MAFREQILVRALIERPETARLMARVFDPCWLEDAPLQPVLQQIYDFTREKGTPPTISTLREIFRSRDESIYDNRLKQTLDELEGVQFSISDAIYEVDRAREVAITRSFSKMIQSERVREMQMRSDANPLLNEVREWMRSFEASTEAVEMNLKEAIEHLIRERSWDALDNVWIKSGIEIIDEWSGGGLQKAETGIILAPTGSGKSVLLLTIAWNIAKQLERNVLLISNELTMRQTAERFISKITGSPLSEVRNDPLRSYHGLERHWTAGTEKHLFLIEKIREFDTDWIEEVIAKYVSLYGWKPDVIVIDYMERMRPTVTGVRRDQSWNWLKYIGQDLSRLAKTGKYLVWTAAQLNRQGYDAPEPSLSHAQGSMMHLQEADFITIVRKIKNPDPTSRMDLLQFACRKARSARGDLNTVYVEADLSKLHITNRYRTDIVLNTEKAPPSHETFTVSEEEKEDQRDASESAKDDARDAASSSARKPLGNHIQVGGQEPESLLGDDPSETSTDARTTPGAPVRRGLQGDDDEDDSSPRRRYGNRKRNGRRGEVGSDPVPRE